MGTIRLVRLIRAEKSAVKSFGTKEALANSPKNSTAVLHDELAPDMVGTA